MRRARFATLVASRALAAIALLIASWGVYATSASARSRAPTCRISPTSAVPAAGVLVSGSRWKPRSTVRISFVQDRVATSLGKETVNRRGRFSDRASVPKAALPHAASFVVGGKDEGGRWRRCSAAFTVLSPPPDSPPAAALSVSPATGATPLQVTGDASLSTDTDSTPIGTYAFGWGDGSTTPTQTGATATHTYTAAGTYMVAVTVTDTGGLSSTATAAVNAQPPTAAWGVDAYSAPPGSIRTAEADMGGSFASWATYRRIDGAATYPTVVNAPMSRGALVYLNINNYAIDPNTGTKIPYCWSNVSNGTEDSMIDAWAQAIVASGYMDKTIVTFNHEPDVSNSIQPRCSTDDAPAYRAAFDYFYKRIRFDGVTSRFAFVPTAPLYAKTAISSYLPPVGDFQLIGADVYNQSGDTTSTGYRTVSQAFDPFYSWAAANEPGMPLIIGELGENQNDPNAPMWISEALTHMKSHGNLLFVNWNLEDTGTAYYSPLLRLDSYQVWLSGAADPYFGA